MSRADAGGSILDSLPARVRVVEVAPRDGLQNEPVILPTEEKVRLIERLVAAGVDQIEVTSFVSPRAVPQLADAEAVLAALPPRPGVTYSALVPNQRGLQRALAAGVGQVALFTAASDTFARHNIGLDVAHSLAAFAPLAAQARQAGCLVRGYVSVAFGCPYEGDVPPARVYDVARRLFDLGVEQVSLGDTIGVATPRHVAQVAGPLLPQAPPDGIALHLHDTRGTALANALAGLLLGISTLDSAAGGLGGCPYAPGAAGNLATEDLIYLLHGMGIETGIDLEAVAAASRVLAVALGRPLRSRYLEATAATATTSTTPPDVLKSQ